MKHVKNCARVIIIVFVVFAVPVSARAFLQITELMYDVSGTDSGREWIEVTNTGSVAEDVSVYKLFEDNTGHGITVVSGSATLSSGASGIIVTDQAKFIADWPSYAGPLYKSSFSLSNTGETIGLKDETLTLIDSIAYDSGLGAQGDGSALVRSGAVFVAGTPTPGSHTGSVSAPTPGPAPTPTPQPNIPATTQQITSDRVGSETLDVTLTTQPVVVAGGGSFFSGSAKDSKGLKADVRYIWNFGDGSAAEGKSIFHTYTYPGTYVVTLTAAAGEEAGMGRTTIHVIAPAIGVLVQHDGSVVISNQSSQEVNVGLWSITSGASAFPLPQETILLGNQSLRFSPNLMQFVAGQDTALRYPNGAIVASAVKMPEVIDSSQSDSEVNSFGLSQQQLSKKSSDLLPSVGQTSAQDISASALAAAVGGVASLRGDASGDAAYFKTESNSADGGAPQDALSQVSLGPQQNPAARPQPSQRVAAEAPQGILQILVELSKSLPLWSWVLGGVGLGLVGIGSLPYIASLRPKKPLETHAQEDEFKLQ